MTTAAVVLAAGGGTRFAGTSHKLLAPLRGRTVAGHAIAAAVAAALDATFVVVGSVDLSVPDGAVVVRNEAWANGIATSLQAGLAAAAGAGHDAVVVGLGDQPFVEAEAWRLLAAVTDVQVAAATYGGRRGNPVRLAAGVWPLLPTTGDAGARALLAREDITVRGVPCPGSDADIDTAEDLARWS